jgi:cellulose biosynthesis protein BcsQ
VNQVVQFFQQYGPLFVTLAAIATVLGLAFTIYKTSHGRQVRGLRDQIQDLREEIGRKDQRIKVLERDGPEGLRLINRQLKEQAEENRDAVRKTKADHAATDAARCAELSAVQEKYDAERQKVDGLSQALEAAREELAEKQRLDGVRAKVLKRAMKLEGKVWERRPLQGTPQFRPLNERHAAVLSVLNLKGGVGKTTVTANLGAAFARKGYRVLLVDLDLQGSLSGLFVHETVLGGWNREKRMLQHFLIEAAEKRKANVLEYCAPIFDGKSAILPNSDSMAYAELNLTMRWLLREGKRDTRFLLRKGLQQKRVARAYDIVLLDCPPLFNTCCVNALAASDYILIPVVPSQQAIDRVPLLLERLQGLHQVINPSLQVMGALLNRTRGASLTAWEQDLWHDMLEQGQDRWRLPVHAFGTFIRQTTEVREHEAEYTPPAPGSELGELFARLAAEVEARLPGDCRRTAAAPVAPG